MDAAAAIATEATHGPSHPACQATRHTWQVAHQVAVAKGLLSAAQHRRRGRPIALTVHNVTTARDLQAHRASAARRRTSYGQLARNNLSTLKGLNAQPGVPLPCAQTLALRQPASSASPTRPPNRETCARNTQQTQRPAPTPRGTNLGCGIRGTRGGGEETGGRNHAAGLSGGRGHT